MGVICSFHHSKVMEWKRFPHYMSFVREIDLSSAGWDAVSHMRRHSNMKIFCPCHIPFLCQCVICRQSYSLAISYSTWITCRICLSYTQGVYMYIYIPIILSLYYILSINRGYKQNDNTHITTVTMVKLRSYFHSPTTPHTSPSRASYGVSFVCPPKKNYHDISRTHCMVDTRSDYSTIVSRANLAFASMVSIGIYLVTKS